MSTCIVGNPGKYSYRILRPDYEKYVPRERIEGELWKSIDDPRCYVSHLTGIGGAGKTSVALSFAIKLYERTKFDYIVYASARDRALTRSGIVETTPSLTSYELLLNQVTEVLELPVSDVARYTLEEQEKLLVGLLAGTKTLLVLDNLETVDDDRIFGFIDRLPVPVRVLATSRGQRIQKSVYPIKVDGMTPDESLKPALWSRPHESVKLSPDTELPILRGGGSDDPQRRL
jgi:hypothetical protein